MESFNKIVNPAKFAIFFIKGVFKETFSRIFVLTPDFLKAFDRNFKALSKFSCAEGSG